MTATNASHVRRLAGESERPSESRSPSNSVRVDGWKHLGSRAGGSSHTACGRERLRTSVTVLRKSSREEGHASFACATRATNG